MRRFCSFAVLLILAAHCAAGADRLTVSKNIPSSAGPWLVTLSVNYLYPYGAFPAPPAAFSAADGFAFAAGDVLTVQYNSGLWCAGTYVSLGTCVDANGYPNYAPVNDTLAGVYAPSKYIDKGTYPVLLMQLVGTFADSRGQIIGTPFKIGNGPLDITVPAGATQLQLGANLYDYSNARDYYAPLNVSVTGPPAPTMHDAGAMAHLAVGGSWKTTLVLVNSGTGAARVRLSFFDDDGDPFSLPLAPVQTPPAGPVPTAMFESSLAAGASIALRCEAAAGAALRTGSARLATDGDVSGFAIFGSNAGSFDQEAVVPLEARNAASYMLWFDNTAGMVVGVALANLGTQQISVGVTIRDDAGSVIGTDQIPLAAKGHTSFALPARLAQTADRRGTVEFRTAFGGALAVLGLRFNPGAFTTIPVIAK